MQPLKKCGECPCFDGSSVICNKDGTCFGYSIQYSKASEVCEAMRIMHDAGNLHARELLKAKNLYEIKPILENSIQYLQEAMGNLRPKSFWDYYLKLGKYARESCMRGVENYASPENFPNYWENFCDQELHK